MLEDYLVPQFYLITAPHQSLFFDLWKFAPISMGKGLT
ncbi:hypothetical protein O53_2048 [Microcystis aeruginosa TAIHU98]|uniref:Uncharacterized protein n=1 Tax=Microcystis aeruginosa TAIHU98 TaxID=1134457 RepID=L7E2H7_MICAE|nr:hypothetical protein O53_2048 [Microcystis aeruginosa TAIHU98]